MGEAGRQADRGLLQATCSPRAVAATTALKTRTLTKFNYARPQWLADAHAELYTAFAEAYGWDAGVSEEEALTASLALILAEVGLWRRLSLCDLDGPVSRVLFQLEIRGLAKYPL